MAPFSSASVAPSPLPHPRRPRRRTGCQWPPTGRQMLAWAGWASLVGAFFWATLPCAGAAVVAARPSALLLPTTAALGGAYAAAALVAAATCLALTAADPTAPGAVWGRGRVSPAAGAAAAPAADAEGGGGPTPQPPPPPSLPPGCVSCALCGGAPVPSTARHCMDCGRCVDGFDHHCPWVGNDVRAGGRGGGKPAFLVMLAAATAQAGLQVACAALALWAGCVEAGRDQGTRALEAGPHPPWWLAWTAGAGAGSPAGAGAGRCGAPARLAASAAGGGVALAAGGALGALFAYHGLLAWTGQTTYERVMAARRAAAHAGGGGAERRGGRVAPV